MIGLLVFIFGIIIGSFLNVVIYRFNSGKSLGGRSQCMKCGKTLSWYELIPVVSFVIQLGRCRSCKNTFSWQYPIVELLSGLLWLLVYLSGASLGAQVSLLIVLMILIVLSVYDYKHMILPDFFVVIIGIISVLSLFIPSVYYPLMYGGGGTLIAFPGWEALTAGPLVALPLFLIFLLSRGRAMGFGDVKLSLVLGWFLGISYGFSMILISFLVGGVFGIIYIGIRFFQKNKGVKIGKQKVPFGPFIAIAFTLVVLLNISFFDLIHYLSVV
jgi:leader peptidase (prepilin peptidase)/N-methyltransferase